MLDSKLLQKEKKENKAQHREIIIIAKVQKDRIHKKESKMKKDTEVNKLKKKSKRIIFEFRKNMAEVAKDDGPSGPVVWIAIPT